MPPTPRKKTVVLQLKLELEEQEKRDILCFCVQNDLSITAWVTNQIRQKLKELELDR